ncbi:hypothetical protein H490_0100710 [Leucobacter sp. UCD-THU]|uniref:Ig-like domain-containing protein n=1 Tax=Leucobacter sp. UCD-THU TaxID=1292023 RepID=UPI00037EF6D1|nr:Ig-like domain-containing protein [Leucobacter sp. UCD-THU]EYT56651.1 hypothetical protein H490_0100710 [Leucobacter sp. UCD-THU]
MMLQPYFQRAEHRSRTARLVAGGLALLLGVGALLGIAAPAQAAPPTAPTVGFTLPAGGGLVELQGAIGMGNVIVAVSPSAGASVSIQGPTQIVVSPTQTPAFPNHRTQATVGYTVESDGETASGQIDLTFVHKPWVFASGLSDAVVAAGETVQLRVEARGEEFVAGAATGGSSYSVKAQPSMGTAAVASDGVVTYTAPANAVPNSTATVRILATDHYGQTGETYQPLTFTIKGTAEADTFGVDIPSGDGNTSTRVEILPDHARGVNPRLTSVLANPGNAAVSFDATGATFTPPVRNWGPLEASTGFVAPYTITDDNGPATAQVNVRVLRAPVITAPTLVGDVPVGGSATSAVKVLNGPVIPATDGYSIVAPPSFGTATVNDAGVVAYAAPAGMPLGTIDSVTVRVTDKVGQSETVDVRFEAYEGAAAPDITMEQPDAAFVLDLLDGSGGEGKALAAVSLVSGDAAVQPDLASGAVAVMPDHAWSAGEAAHEITLAYTVADARGGTATGTVTVAVLPKPAFAHTAPGLVSKTARVGDLVQFDAGALLPGNLPETGAFTMLQQPTALPKAGAAGPAAAMRQLSAFSMLLATGPATVNEAGIVTVDTRGMAVNTQYELVVRATDRVGQFADQTFRINLAAAAARTDEPGVTSATSGAARLASTGADPSGLLLAAGALLLGCMLLVRRSTRRSV